MSARAPPSSDDNDEWSPSSTSSKEGTREAISGVGHGIRKIVEGGAETAQSLLLLGLLVVDALLNRAGEEETTDAQERSAQWDARAEPIQQRFEDEDVDESDIEDAIEWARSQ